MDQILEDNQMSRSIERERQHSIISLFGSSASPPLNQNLAQTRDSAIRRESTSLVNFDKNTFSPSAQNKDSLLSKSLNGESILDNDALDESPFGPLKYVRTRKTFAYLIAILNSTYPDHDFSNLQPSTENFHRINSAEDLIHRFNNIMISLGKREDLLNWIWDIINVYMDIIPSKTSSPQLAAQSDNGTGSRKNSFNHSGSLPRNGSGALSNSPPNNGSGNNFDNCQIYQFQPSDESILDDLNYPYQTMWSYYWFIYNKKKKRVSFVYLTAINKSHYYSINNNKLNTSSGSGNNDSSSNKILHDEDDEDGDVAMYTDEFMDEDDDEVNDIVGDIEI